MSDLSRYLRRFRRMVAPPGRPGLRAVPSDGPKDTSAELASIIREIDEIAAEAEAIRDEAERSANERQAAARDDAEAVIEKASQQAEVARAGAAAERAEASEQEIASLESDAKAEVDRIAAVSEERMARLVDQIVERVLALDVTEG